MIDYEKYVCVCVRPFVCVCDCYKTTPSSYSPFNRFPPHYIKAIDVSMECMAASFKPTSVPINAGMLTSIKYKYELEAYDDTTSSHIYTTFTIPNPCLDGINMSSTWGTFSAFL